MRSGWAVPQIGAQVVTSLTVVPPGSPYDHKLPGATTVDTPAGVVTGKVLDFGGATYNVMTFNAKGDAKMITDAVMNGTTAVLTSASNPFVSTDVGKLCVVPGAGAAGVPLFTSIASFQSAGQVTLAAVSQTAVSSATAAPATFGTDDFAAIQAAINRAQTEFDEVMIPSVPVGYCTSAPLVISSAANIVGNGVKELFGTKITNINADAFPTIPPYLSGSVIIPMTSGQDGWQFTGVGLTQNMTNVGVRFGGLYNSTGHGFNSTPPADGANFDEGTSGSEWFGCKVYGHDGNHYGFNVINPFYMSGYHLRSYGGGGLNMRGDTSRTQYGNSVFVHPYFIMFVSGTADGINLSANAFQNLNLLAFFRPQVWIRAPLLAVPGSSPVVGGSTNKLVRVDVATNRVDWYSPDMETNVGAVLTYGTGRNLFGAEKGTSIVAAFQPTADANFPLVLDGFSATQSADLLTARRNGSGTSTVFRIGPKGDVTLGDTTGGFGRILSAQQTAPTVGSGGAGVSALSVLTGGTNISLQVQVTLTAVAPGVVVGVVVFNGAPLASAPKNVICSLSAPTAGVASPPVVGADTYTTSGFTIRVYGPTTVTTGTYVIACWVLF